MNNIGILWYIHTSTYWLIWQFLEKHLFLDTSGRCSHCALGAMKTSVSHLQTSASCHSCSKTSEALSSDLWKPGNLYNMEQGIYVNMYWSLYVSIITHYSCILNVWQSIIMVFKLLHSHHLLQQNVPNPSGSPPNMEHHGMHKFTNRICIWPMKHCLTTFHRHYQLFLTIIHD